MWGQRSWQGLAGATGEQMRPVGVRFNLDKRYRMQSDAVPRKDGMNFSHCASDSSFQWVESRRKTKTTQRKASFSLWGLFALSNRYMSSQHAANTLNKNDCKRRSGVCNGVKEKILNLAWFYVLSRRRMWVEANMLLRVCVFVCVLMHSIMVHSHFVSVSVESSLCF